MRALKQSQKEADLRFYHDEHEKSFREV